MIRSSLLFGLVKARKILCNSYGSYQKSTLTYSQWKQTRHFSLTNVNRSNKHLEDEKDEHNPPLIVNPKYKPFDETDAEIIFDVDDEQQLINAEEFEKEIEKEHDPFEGLNVERGVTGVYDIKDLVEVLRKDKAKNIFVATVPPEYGYVDYIVVVSGKSSRHMQALAMFVRKLYKRKRNPSDKIPVLEGRDSKDWLALDLGNIALHILSKEAREYYDLETLWSVGAEYDEQCLSTDQSENLMAQYNAFLAELEPQDPKKLSNQDDLKSQ